MPFSSNDLARLLEDGRRVVSPNERECFALDYLVQTGIATVKWDRVFRCFDPLATDTALAEAPNRTCTQWVSYPNALDDEPAWEEDSGATQCPSCQREHHPIRYGITPTVRASIHLDEKGCISWMETTLQEIDPEARRLREGVGWRLLFNEQELVVVWLDKSLDTRLATRAFFCAETVIYVVTSPRNWVARFRDEPRILLLPLAVWLGEGRKALASFLVPRESTFVTEPSLRPWARERTPDRLVFTKTVGAHELTLFQDRAVLNGTEVISPEAIGLLSILRFFVERWREDLADGKRAADHCTWSPMDISAHLWDTTHAASDSGTLRRQITRLRSGIAERYLKASGLRLNENEIIENIDGHGYRLNPNVFAKLN